ncbi:Asp-tRNA(Asn)/Glu-tRNA(Gln) amidotransferase subunit GatA [Candidatus Woesearchaeota archaeon]|nr:Asp-tRNA(Asn)/Glu-tRNA(Gln) amidotransferase subunit GatA [Candidatus Woesearchaeota archaeon]
MLNKLKTINKEYNFFNVISEDIEKQEKSSNGKLKGLFVSIKDCICVKDMESRAGSRILEGYKPVFNATVIQRLIDEGAIIIGKTSQDEFGFGSFSVNTYNIPKNPFDKERTCGGSSGGSAGVTRKLSELKIKHVSIAESTGGSIACPAAFCGVYGFTPTYGVVSRYGLIDYANSLDKIGVMADNLSDLKKVFDVIKEYDPMDSTSLNKELNNDNSIKKVAVIKESLNVNPEIKELILKTVKDKFGSYDLISLPLVEKYAIPVYYILAMAESSTNLAKYCGMRYGSSLELKGNFDEYFTEVRTKFFEVESKRRIILGTFARMAGYRDAFYIKAAKVRNLIIQEYKKAFEKYDLLISPTMPVIAPKFSEIKKLTPLENYMMDILTVGPNLAGLPHISCNAGFVKKMPVGIMYIANHLNDYKLMNEKLK